MNPTRLFSSVASVTEYPAACRRAVVAEMISGNSGIGYFILNNQRIFRVPEMFAGIFTLGLLGFLINLLFLQLEAYLLRWRTTGQNG